MNRRQFLAVLGLSGMGAAGWRLWPEQGLWNPCRSDPLPEALLHHEVVQAAWQGIDAAQLWDCHVHLAGSGDSDSGIWVNPEMQSLLHPSEYIRFKFYLDASCAAGGPSIDRAYVDRLIRLQQGLQQQSRLLLLAFDYRHDQNGRPEKEQSRFYVPNHYAALLHQTRPDVFEWIASIHPYREDCIEALEWAVAHGARAVKWLPAAMGIDPASKCCDRFYAALRKHDLPLLSHAGEEQALVVGEGHELNHPLRLRYALQQGVRVIVAHCASLGMSVDTDKGEHGPLIHNIELFARLMAEPQYEGLLFGDIAAITQVNRELAVIKQIYQRREWHARLLHGSDYPLPGVMPVFSLARYVDAGCLTQTAADVLSAIRPYNPLLFDFVLKRSLVFDGARLAESVFATAGFFSWQKRAV